MDTDQHPPPGQRFVSKDNRIRNLLHRCGFVRVAFYIPKDTMYDKKYHNGRMTVMFCPITFAVDVLRFDERIGINRHLIDPTMDELKQVLQEVYQIS